MELISEPYLVDILMLTFANKLELLKIVKESRVT